MKSEKEKVSHLAKLVPDQVRAIRKLRGKLTQKEIAQQFGVSQSTVFAVFLRKVYREVV